MPPQPPGEGTPPEPEGRDAEVPLPPPAQTPPAQQAPGPTRPAWQPAGWYSGPFPPPGLTPPGQSFGRSIGSFTLKTLILLALLGIGFVLTIAIFFLFVGGVLTAFGGGATGPQEFVAGEESSGNRLLSVPVEGVILGEEEDTGGFFAAFDATFGYSIKQELEDAADDDSIDGVVLEMNTPGGTIFGSQAIADGVVEYKKNSGGKPIIAFVAGLSASGGMLGMSPADTIIADHGTTIGSIGVISGPFAFYNEIVAVDGGLLAGGVETRGGIDFTTITSGKGKDMGSPFRPLTPEEIAILQQGTDNEYANFVDDVASNRGIPKDKIVNEIGAYVYDNETAKELGLIDKTANRDLAYADLADRAGLSRNDWQVVRNPSFGGGLGGLFARTTSSEAGSGLCASPTLVLAYYGDPRALCPALATSETGSD